MSKRASVYPLLSCLFLLVILAGCAGDEEDASEDAEQSGGQEEQADSSSDEAQASDSEQESFYAGEQITMIIGFAPGGGVDLEARLVGDHLERHIPGNPSFEYQNLEGGSGLVAASVLHNDTQPDGFTVGMPGRGAVHHSPVRGDPGAEYTLEGLENIGGLGPDDQLLIVSDDSGASSFDELSEAPEDSVTFGAFSRATATYVVPYLLAEEAAPAIDVTAGYDSANDMQLAMERGEIEGLTLPYTTVIQNFGDQIEAGDYHVVAKVGDGHSIDPFEGAVQVEEVLSEDALAVLRLIDPPTGLVMFAPPETDPVALQTLRDSWESLMADEEFVEAAEEVNVMLNPVSAEELDQIHQEMMETPEEALGYMREITGME